MSTKDWIATIGAVLAIPAAALGVFQLIRFFRARLREEAPGVAEIEKERAYLFALQGYLEELDQPLGYHQDEYTALAGSLVNEEYVSHRFVVRKSLAEDQMGLSPSDILSSTPATRVRDVLRFLRHSKRPIVVLGEPGSGKSVTMRRIASEVTREEIAHKHVWGAIPIYIQLGAYQDCGPDGKPLPVLDFVKNQLRNVIPGGTNIEGSIEVVLRKGRAVILFDSMDEMPSHDFSERAAALKRFLIEYSGQNQIVVACRKREYSGAFPHSELVVEPFSERRIKQYLDKQWTIYSRLLKPEARHTTRETYTRMAQPQNPLFHFATNPFSLKLLTRFFFMNDGVLPQGRSDIFRYYIEERLLREAQRKNLTDERCKRILAAWRAHAFGVIAQDLGTYVYERQLHEDIRSLAPFGAEEIEDAIEIAVSSGLMRREKDKSIRFEHHRLLEYLAATYLEEHRSAYPLKPEQLRNPWWRETVMLRAGITADPDGLIREICAGIDSGYLTVLGVRAAPAEIGAASQSSQTQRLENLATVELAFVCARQRWDDLSDEIGEILSSYATGIALHGSVLEKVRLVRALTGMPIALKATLLEQLAATSSDWLLEEIIESVDPRDYRTPEFAMILAAIVRAVDAADILYRIRAVRGLSLSMLLRSSNPESKKILLRFAARLFAFWILIAAFTVGLNYASIKWGLGDPVVMVTGGSLWMGAVLPAFFVFIMFAGVGWRVTAALVAFYGALSLVLPPRSVFSLFQFQAIILALTGADFKKAKWIANPVVRGASLFASMHRLVRMFLLALIAQRFLILGAVYYRFGFGIYGWLGELKTTALGTSRIYYGAALGLAIDALIHFIQQRRLRTLLQDGATLVDPDNLTAYLKRCVNELRAIRPRAVSKRILDRIVELPLEESIVINELKGLADSGEFLLKPDEILEAIDRVDLRRKQKTLGGAQVQAAAES